jgi:hypothetical protein
MLLSWNRTPKCMVGRIRAQSSRSDGRNGRSKCAPITPHTLRARTAYARDITPKPLQAKPTAVK